MMPGDNEADVRHSIIHGEPTTIKQLHFFVRTHLGHTRCWRLSQHLLDLRMLQDSISSCSCDQMHTRFNQESNGDCITILPIETNERNLWSEGKAFQIHRNGSE